MSYLLGETEADVLKVYVKVLERTKKPAEKLGIAVFVMPLARKLYKWKLIQTPVWKREEARRFGYPFDETQFSPEIRQAFVEVDEMERQRLVAAHIERRRAWAEKRSAEESANQINGAQNAENSREASCQESGDMQATEDNEAATDSNGAEDSVDRLDAETETVAALCMMEDSGNSRTAVPKAPKRCSKASDRQESLKKRSKIEAPTGSEEEDDGNLESSSVFTGPMNPAIPSSS
ncbi:hypothetical protein L3Y34_013118 [Caenorhabditis briggsae]|uniref:Uncharacterized protein n=1 Tax=Caenorhabditis briggsae TaxID=6238 RepID=A0AAE8ZUF4_CAEBR|nr:hypothetical protein L3Y34_013118 [Caenorhabditis briggsae]